MAEFDIPVQDSDDSPTHGGFTENDSALIFTLVNQINKDLESLKSNSAPPEHLVSVEI